MAPGGRMDRVVLAAAVLAARAAAAAPPRQLTRAEIVAAEDAVRSRLPPVDKQLIAACKPPTASTTIPQQIALARCYARAGALGAAIALLKNASYIGRGEPALEQGRLELAGLEDRIADYAEEADALASWASDYGASPGATADERAQGDRVRTRAICLWLQLGDRRGAGEARRRKDRDHMCDGLALIAAPPAGAR